MKTRKVISILVGIIILFACTVPYGFAAEGMKLSREVHYAFAHRALPSLLFTRKEGLLKAFENRGQAFVEGLWAAVEKADGKPDQPLDRTGLAYSKETLPGMTFYLVQLPKPEAIAEAYFAAVAEKGDTTRYFTLEFTSPLARCEGGTILGEWTSDGRHQNYGCGPKPEKQEFMKAIAGRF